MFYRSSCFSLALCPNPGLIADSVIPWLQVKVLILGSWSMMFTYNPQVLPLYPQILTRPQIHSNSHYILVVHISSYLAAGKCGSVSEIEEG
jgi:hypothetical protein